MSLSDFIFNRSQNHPVYMPYLTIGDPSFEKTEEYALAIIDAGADILELGIPFSDPTADGPVIQAAMVRALSQPDFSIEKVFETARLIHEKRPDVPLVFLTYLNPVLNGLKKQTVGAQAPGSHFDASQSMDIFLKECDIAGISGVVIPDLPHDMPESEMFRALSNGVEQILMIAPNTRKKRFKEICRTARGFIYYVTSLGVTGERREFPSDIKDNIARVKKTSGLPVMAGFGFTKPEQTKPLIGVVDGIIVGSLNHKIIEEKKENATEHLAEVTRGFVQTLRTGSFAGSQEN